MAGAARWAKGGWMNPGFDPRVGQCLNFMKVARQLPASYMQNLHNLMRQLICNRPRSSVTPQWLAGKKKAEGPEGRSA